MFTPPYGLEDAGILLAPVGLIVVVEFDTEYKADDDDEAEKPPLGKLVDDGRLSEPVGPIVAVELKVGYGAVKEPTNEDVTPPEVLDDKDRDPELNDPILGLKVDRLFVPVGPMMDEEFNVGYGADEDPTDETIMPPDTLDVDGGDPELNGPTLGLYVDRLLVPVGLAGEVEFDIGYGTVEDLAEEAIVPKESLDKNGAEPEIEGSTVEGLRLPVPAGLMLFVELEV